MHVLVYPIKNDSVRSCDRGLLVKGEVKGGQQEINGAMGFHKARLTGK